MRDPDCIFKIFKAFSHAHRAAQPVGWETSTVSDPLRFSLLVNLQAPFIYVPRLGKFCFDWDDCVAGSKARTQRSRF